MKVQRRTFGATVLAAVLVVGLTCIDQAAAVEGKTDAIVKEMRQGGLVLVFRHTATKHELPGTGPVLSQEGEDQAAGAGQMLRELRVPTGDTYTSTGKHAVETARLARFGNAMALKALTDGSMPLSRVEGEDRAEVFRSLLRERPQRGMNVVMVADKASIVNAIGPHLVSLQEGELVVVRPDVRVEQGFDVVGRLTLREVREYWNQRRAEPTFQRVRW